jgi:hypothetical protein
MTVEEWLGKDNTLGKDIIEKKYLYKGETLDHWFDRISNGDQELRNLIVEKKFMPGGRILAHRGVPQDEMRSTYSNCFSGETKIVTSEGLKELKDLVGKDIKVLANLNWRDATVKSFGVQELRRLTLRKDRSEEEMVFYVTGDHLWYVVKNLIKSLKPTDSLEVDDVIPSETFGEIWKVVSLEKTDRVEEVFCAVVPETECFALEGNVLTHNCYVLGTDDSLEEIYKTCANMARTYSLGGGVGVDISKLRPRGAIVHNSAKETTGAVSFMKTFDVVTETIGQNGRRK